MKTRIVSFTQLGMLLRCKWKWGVKYRLGLTAREVSVPMALGGLLHDALAYWYSTHTLDWQAVRGMARNEIEPEVELEAQRIMEAYVAHYGDEADVETLAVEWPFTVPVRTPGGYPANYRLIGWVDRITRDHQGIWLWDHKSGKSFVEVPVVTLDYQLTTYAWALRQMGAPVVGVVLNLVATTKEPKFRRDRILKLPRELDNWGRVLYSTCRDIPPPRLPWSDLPRSPMPRNCGWDCDFYELCRLDVEGQTDAFNDLAEVEYKKKVFDGDNVKYLKQYNKRIPAEWRKGTEGRQG